MCLPVRIACLVVANISLCGIPFLRGFYSKDLIIELRFMKGEVFIIYLLEVVGTLFTSWYSLRLRYNVMFGLNKSSVRVKFGEEAADLKASYLFLLLRAVRIG